MEFQARAPLPVRGNGRFNRDILPAAGLLVAGLVGLLIASLSNSDSRGQYVVVMAPWSNEAGTVDRISSAGGGFLQLGGFANIIIAASSEPDFASRMRAAGSWLVFPFPGIAGCFTPPSTGSTDEYRT